MQLERFCWKQLQYCNFAIEYNLKTREDISVPGIITLMHLEGSNKQSLDNIRDAWSIFLSYKLST